jgi:hypothetical protein
VAGQGSKKPRLPEPGAANEIVTLHSVIGNTGKREALLHERLSGARC